MSVVAVRELLARHQLASRRDLGQNFLVDPDLARKLVRRAGVAPEEAVLEVGTGLGILTRALAEVAREVVTLEVDAGLVRALRAEGGLPGHVALHHADALQADLGALLPEGPVRVVASLPYVISSVLLRRLLDLRRRLRGWSVVVQREVAERVTAAPGTRSYGSLTVLHQLTVTVDGALDLHPRCFYPVPRVASRFVNVHPLAEPLLAPGELPSVERVVRAAFRHRRKTLINSLATCARSASSGLELPPIEDVQVALAELGIEPQARAEQVGPRLLLALARRLAAEPSGAGAARG